jgi:hypothetical protein
MELYESLGFDNNPFSTFSAEQEREFLDRIYIKPNNYRSLKSDIKDCKSRFILGARGIGKTALLYKLKKDLEEDNIFCVLIDEFDGIPRTKNKAEFLKLIIEEITKLFCISLSKTPGLLKNLSSVEKEKLSFIIAEFFKSLSHLEYENSYNKATKFKSRNFFRKMVNFFNSPINLVITGCVEIASDAIRTSLGLPDPNPTKHIKNYIPNLKLEEIRQSTNPSEFLNDPKALKLILNDLSLIIKKSGFGSLTILIDRVDEYTLINSGIQSISSFLKDLLTDTTVLLNQNYAFVIGLWDALKSTLDNYTVRFDKIKPVDINWNKQLMLSILDKRISHFSSNKVTKEDIFTETAIDEIVKLSNNSPRYLFRQLAEIYDFQNNEDNLVKRISDENVSKGQLIYCKDFEFYSIYPSKKGSKEDVIVNINRLLKIGHKQIKTKDFVDSVKVSTPTAISYIKIVQDYGIVKYIGETENGAKTYEIDNPILIHLIENNITGISK